ncbi:carbon monoxide dehydrogenase [Herbaspirillum sp. HC18]|nr:carbon monoxide dehydrogenase [Herbaspirillum sp. HC18]
MEMSNSRLVPASRETVWAALNDPEILKDCIPGCERIEATAADAFRIAMVAKVGAIRAKFNGRMHIENILPIESYTLVFEGEGGMSGFAKGSANVSLAIEGDSTRLTYLAKAYIGGKLAQIGSRLLDNAAHKTADEFFAAFAERLVAIRGAAGIHDEAPGAPSSPPAVQPQNPDDAQNSPPLSEEPSGQPQSGS